MKKYFIAIITIILVISTFSGCADRQDLSTDSTTISNELFMITVPDDWPERIYTEINDKSIHVYQKSAHEAGCGGFIFSISLYSDEFYKEIPCHQLLCEKDGKYIVAEFPSDVQADVENEESMKEYFEMFDQAPLIIKETFTLL